MTTHKSTHTAHSNANLKNIHPTRAILNVASRFCFKNLRPAIAPDLKGKVSVHGNARRPKIILCVLEFSCVHLASTWEGDDMVVAKQSVPPVLQVARTNLLLSLDVVDNCVVVKHGEKSCNLKKKMSKKIILASVLWSHDKSKTLQHLCVVK